MKRSFIFFVVGLFLSSLLISQQLPVKKLNPTKLVPLKPAYKFQVQGIKRILTKPSKIKFQVQYYISPNYPKPCFIGAHIVGTNNWSHKPAGRLPNGVRKGQVHFTNNVVVELNYTGSTPFTSTQVEVFIYDQTKTLTSTKINWGHTWSKQPAYRFQVQGIKRILTTPSKIPRQAEAQLADTPWPIFHHDLQHTGRSPYHGANSGDEKWAFRTGSHYLESSPAIGSDGTIYVGSEDGKLYAIYPEHGTEKWHFDTGRSVVSSPAIGSDGTIYVGSCNNKLYAIYPVHGTEKWHFDTGNRIYNSSPAIGSDGTIYVGSEDGKLYAINPDGTEKWHFETGDSVDSSPAIGSDGTIYVGSYDNKLYAIYPVHGTEKWHFDTGSGVRSSPAIGSDGTIYVGSTDNKLYAIYPEHGTEKWHFDTGRSVVSSPAIASDGTIYVGSLDGKLYAINPDGTEKWHFETGERISSSPAIGSDGTIYVGSEDGKLYAIGFLSSPLWDFDTGGGVRSSPAIGRNGTIYVGSNNYRLYAIGVYNFIVTVKIVPAYRGTITFDGDNYSDGNWVSRALGTYNISANPDAAYTFARWETEGDISVDNPNSATTTCTVSGRRGTLRMVQTMKQIAAPYTVTLKQIAAPYTVTFDMDPPNKGYIEFDGVNYSDGNTVSKAAGTYDIEAKLHAQYTFIGWETEGGLTVEDSGSATTTFTIGISFFC